MNYIIDILPLLFFILPFIGIKYFPSKDGWNREYLSMETSASVKGLLCLAVMYHHLSQCTSDGLIFPMFSYIYFLVGMFFFYSGYGLQKRNLGDENYYVRFGLKRIPCVLFPYVAVTLLYWLLSFFTSEPYSAAEVFKGFFNGHPIVNYSWYVIAILAFYCFFDILLHLFHRNNRALILGVGLFCVLWILVCRTLLHVRSFWYRTIHLLLFGVLWATYEQDILKFATKKTWLWIFLTLVLSFLSVLMEKLQILNSIPTLAVLFAFLVMLLLLKFNVSNRVLKFLGNISYEVYLTQGIFIKVFRSPYFSIENDGIFCISALLATIAASYILHLLFSRILSRYRAAISHVK
ncbi:MAG: acyltransferase family protein [Candidatus Limivicinus sp.]